MKSFVLFFKYCFLPSRGFSTNNFTYGNATRFFFFEAFKIIDYWNYLQYFLFRDCLKSKVGSLISFLFKVIQFYFYH